MKKKIGIMSMQRINNYGSFLQAYALKNIIEEMGHEVEFVDYHVDKPIIYDLTKKRNMLVKGLETLKIDAPLIQKIQYIKHKREFSKKYHALLGIKHKFNYNPKLDALIIGSDEVFNCIQSNENVGYSLELFGKDNNSKQLISYAASFGNTTYSKIEKYNKCAELAKYMKKFDAISVRDNNSETIVEKLINQKPEIHLDPVLIFDYMNRKEITCVKTKEKFMIVYAYSGRISKQETKCIRQYANLNKLKVYAIGGPQRCADKFIDCSPFEVLGYFKKAECIVTDTFHGSIFSIINNKPFATLIRKSHGNSYGNQEKLTDLLNRLQLNNKIVENIDELSNVINETVDYQKTNKIIINERKKTIEYLKQLLGK